MTAIQQYWLGMRQGGDPFWDDVVFLLDTTGAAPADASQYNATPAFGSNPPTLSAVQSKWGGKSVLLNNLSQHWVQFGNAGLTIPYDAGGYPLPYTIEGWAYLSTPANWSRVDLFSLYQTDAAFRRITGSYSGSANRYVVSDTDAFGDQFHGFYTVPPTRWPLAQWAHLAIVRAAGIGSTTRVYLDGVQVGTLGVATPLDQGTWVARLGWNSSVDACGIEYVDQVRVTLAERYTGASFTVPAGPFPTK